MTDDAALLALTQWLSPAFPVGGFAWSQGLETAIADGHVRDRASLEQWLSVSLRTGALWSDAVILAAALRKDADHAALSWEARARAGSAERLAETQTQGAAFTSAQNALAGVDFPAAPLPVAIGRAAAPLGLPAERIVALALQSAVSSLALGAVRHIPLGQTDGQAVVGGLSGAILDVAKRAVATGLDDLATATPGADLAQMRHETQEVRIFRS